MADRTINERVGSLEGFRKDAEERIDELESQIAKLREFVSTDVPRKRGNPNWVKKVVSEDQ